MESQSPRFGACLIKVRYCRPQNKLGSFSSDFGLLWGIVVHFCGLLRNLGLRSVDLGLLWSIVASCFGLLGLPGTPYQMGVS